MRAGLHSHLLMSLAQLLTVIRFRHRLATAAFAAVYGCFAMFGSALHLLDGHGAHFGHQVIECAEHGYSRDGHSHDVDCVLHKDGGHNLAHGVSPASDEPLHVAARCCDTFSHDCQICQYLSQARAATVATGSVLGRPLVSCDSPSIFDEFTASVGLGQQAPRGPPALLA
jgi:hypothetical protein